MPNGNKWPCVRMDEECGKRETKVALHDYMPLCDKAFSRKGPVLHTLVRRILSLKVINLKGYKTA